jgi:hypothetical protein
MALVAQVYFRRIGSSPAAKARAGFARVSLNAVNPEVTIEIPAVRLRH